MRSENNGEARGVGERKTKANKKGGSQSKAPVNPVNLEKKLQSEKDMGVGKGKSGFDTVGEEFC